LISSAPRLYLVTDRQATGGRPLADVIVTALRGVDGTGLSPRDVAVQLREKDLHGRELTELARTLRTITRAAGVALFVNDRADVALAVGADGVHLGAASLAAGDVARVAPGLAIAVSAHAPADVAAARAIAAVSFAVFGPIHDTPSKRAWGAPLGEGALTEAARAGLPLLAIGGLEPAQVARARQAGAHGVACIRAVMAAPDPAAAVRAFCGELTA
jgi:thiamine-phosphate pyrophosphorylase